MLVLLRHGQTTSNVEHYLDTSLPGAALTELGQQQAKAAGAEIMERFSPVQVVTSRALRAQQTGAIGFGEAFSEIPALGGLEEIQAGDFEMMNSRSALIGYHGAISKFYRREMDVSVPGGDSLEVFLARYRPAVESVIRSGGEATSVIVSHGGAIRAFAANAADIDPEFAEASYLPNCRYVVLDPVGEFGAWQVVEWGDYPLPPAELV